MQIGHIGLNVSDLNRSITFYTEVLGLKLRTLSEEPGKRFAYLGDDTKNTVTLWEQSEGTFSKRTPGLHHLAFEADSAEAVKSYEEKLKAYGASFIYEGLVVHREGGDSGGIFFEDPDGIRVEIYTAQGVSGHDHSSANGSACGFF
ncbi:VOC family protein [Paenibacillus sp. R14(2021)]|uniref:VOC family protein n=1 Tax=Paenibacillus sp. R14(2021) TaxID=2859228 RepID=UPI001C612C89|nr:VOC family protein [Paenibacillus sp. R14(2021)]